MKKVLSLILCTVITLGFISPTIVLAGDKEQINSNEKRNVPIIEDIKLPNFDSTKMHAGSTQGLELSVVTALNYLDGSNKITLSNMLKTKYPEVTENNFENYSFSAKDCFNFINTETQQKVQWSNNLLTEDIIRTQIKKNKPIIVYLTANNPENYWIESRTGIIIYGYTYLNFGPGQVIFDIQAYSPNHSAPILNLSHMNDINLLGGIAPSTTFKYAGSMIFN